LFHTPVHECLGTTADRFLVRSIARGSGLPFRTRAARDFDAGVGEITARKEHRGQTAWYWKAYRKRTGVVRSAYLGKSADLTLDRLHAIATRISPNTPPHHPQPNLPARSEPSAERYFLFSRLSFFALCKGKKRQT
jgi:hypothetical protein